MLTDEMPTLIERIKDLEHELADSRAHRVKIEREIKSLEAQKSRIDHSVPLPRFGVDYSFSRPPLNRLKSVGVSFVIRYITGAGKAITSNEAKEISDNGLDLVVCYEESARRMSDGYRSGAEDAAALAHDLAHIGIYAPIYFVCDFDAAGEGLTGDVLEYLRGAVHAIGWDRVGFYAGYRDIVAAHSENRCKYFWQTLAWSYGKWAPFAQLRQTQNNVSLFGAAVDFDKAVAADFGQFKI